MVEAAAFFCAVSAFSNAQHLLAIVLVSGCTFVACQGRHRDSIDFFVTNEDFGFSYTALTDKIKNDQLRPEVRRAFTRLLTALYIDRCEDPDIALQLLSASAGH